MQYHCGSEPAREALKSILREQARSHSQGARFVF